MRSPTRAGAAAFALTLAGLALSARSADAQYNKTEPPKTRFRVGPLRFTPRLELRNAGRDSNVYLDPTNPLADTSIVVRGSVEGFVPVGRRLRLFGEAWLDWSYYQQQDTETSTDPGGEGRAEIDVGAFTFMAGGGALQARQLYSIDIDERILREERWVNAGAEWRLTRRFLVSGGAEERSFRFDPRAGLSVAASLNRNSLVGTLAARYTLTSMTTMVGTADVFQDEFQLSAPGLDRTRSYRYLAGFEFGEKAMVTGRFLAGLRDFPASTSGSLPSYRGPAFTGELALPLFNRVRLVGTFQRDVFVSATAVRTAEERARNAYVLTSLQGSAEIDLAFDLVGRATLGYSEAEYLLPQIVSGVPFPREDHLYTAGGSLMRQFSASLRAGVSATYYRRVSTIPGQSYDRWTYGVTAEIVP